MATASAAGRPGAGMREQRPSRESLKSSFFNPDLFEKRYQADHIISEGTFATVCQAHDICNREKFVIKRVQNVFENGAKTIRVLREIKFFRFLSKHEDIVSMKGILEPRERGEFEDIFIVFEPVSTDLDQLLKSRTPLTKAQIKFLLLQILCAMHFIRTTDVTHCDFNPRSILVDKHCNVGICRFDSARASFRRTDDRHLWKDHVSTVFYQAPELILSESKKYSTALDMWSVGCIFAEMLSVAPLFSGNDAEKQLELIARVVQVPDSDYINSFRDQDAQQVLRRLPSEPEETISARLPDADTCVVQLLQGLLEFDSNKRMSAIEALESPYFSNYRPISIGPPVDPLQPADFAFDGGKWNYERMGDEILREIALYHPGRASEILSFPS